jgi:predicted alpha/beta hydrolase family esterase
MTGPAHLAGIGVGGMVAQQLAGAWGVPRIGAGRLGHINSSSGIGRWDFGRALFTAFTAGLKAPTA